MLSFTQLLHDLSVDIVLHSSLSCVVEVLALVSVAILLALPHQGLLLGSDFKHRWVKSFENGVSHASLLVHDALGLSCHLVVESVASLEITRGGSTLLHH